MTKTIELGEKPNWLIYDDNWGGIDINQSTDTDTIHNLYWYGFTILANGLQMYFDKPEMLVFLKCFTDKKNQSVLRKEMSKLEEELTEGENRIDEKENSV
jgi:hypothetical protein